MLKFYFYSFCNLNYMTTVLKNSHIASRAFMNRWNVFLTSKIFICILTLLNCLSKRSYFFFSPPQHMRGSISLYSFPGGSDSKGSACKAGDPALTPGLGRSPGEGNGYPLQSSCLENPMDRGAWWAAVHGAAVRHNQSHACTCTQM